MDSTDCSIEEHYGDDYYGDGDGGDGGDHNFEEDDFFLSDSSNTDSFVGSQFDWELDCSDLELEDWDELSEIEKFICELCSFVSDVIDKRKSQSIPLFLYDNQETPLNTIFNTQIGISVATPKNSVLPQGTYCIPVPNNYIDLLHDLQDLELLQMIIKGFNQTRSNTPLISVRQARKIFVCHPFKRNKENSVMLNAGFGLNLEIKLLC